MEYYLMMPGDTEQDALNEANLLGEASFSNFWGGQGLTTLMTIVDKQPELLPLVKIKTNMSNKNLSVEEFLTAIQVMDGPHVVHEESVKNMKSRDEVVWRLADLYNAIDIEVKDIKQDEFRFTEIPSIPVLEEEEADEFFEDNKDFVYERILQAVEEGVRAERDVIRLFELNGTDVYITSEKVDWKNGVQQALDYYISVEQYDKCITARQLMLKL